MSNVDLTINPHLKKGFVFSNKAQSPFRCDGDTVLVLMGSCILLSTSPSIRSCPITPLAAEPGIRPVCLRDEGYFPGHFRVVDPLAVLVALPLPLSARLLEIALAFHRLYDSILSQDPGVCRENV